MDDTYGYDCSANARGAVGDKSITSTQSSQCAERGAGTESGCGRESIRNPVYADSRANRMSSARCRFDDLSPQRLGIEGERIAARYLERRGWEIVERNWICPYGEADIIAKDDNVLVLVEVKTRTITSERHVSYPELAVDEAKQRRYKHIAECYMAESGTDSVRFDIVAVTIVAERTAHIHHLVSAYGCDA